jgi:nitrite reductase/ring-hydroxylating ferredoxin subunit/uncharacterized membrane protein
VSTDTAIRRLEASSSLDKAGRALANAFAGVVRPGPLRDVLSGTPLRHPAHPLLTDVTIGLWASAAVLDVARVPQGADLLVGAGALSALPTALTGVNDLADITDPASRSVAVTHAAGNVAALALFLASYAARRAGARRAGVTLSALGLGALTGAGFLGGHLAYRRGVGVDTTVFEPAIGDWTPALDDADLKAGRPRRATVNGVDVMLVREAGAIYALANRCTHRGAPLHKGKLAEGCVTCPWHLSMFRLQDGEVVRGPATAPQPVFDVRVEEGAIQVRSRRAG